MLSPYNCPQVLSNGSNPQFFGVRLPILTNCSPVTASTILIGDILTSGGCFIASSSTMGLDTPANLITVLTGLSPYTLSTGDSIGICIHNNTGGICTLTPGPGYVALTNMNIPTGVSRYFRIIWAGGSTFNIF